MPPLIRNNDIQALVFDLGNVLIDIDFFRCARIWSDRSGIPATTLAARFRIDEAYRAFECGQLPPAGYFDTLRRQLGINLSDEAMQAGWNAIIRDEKPGVRAILKGLAHRFPLYVLTNTNPVHERVWASAHKELLSYFKGIFVSSRMGCRKPDAAVYREVAQSIDRPCAGILFFDDDPENIAGARRTGMQAIHVDSTTRIARWVDSLVAPPGRPI
ncbi:MAG: HAD-IA family hydrolase [Desulfobacterales bacterium]|jgi:putative hydrolase of the HAD superfamily